MFPLKTNALFRKFHLTDYPSIKSVLLAKQMEIRVFSYQVHSYGGGHGRLNLCSHVLNEGVFVLPMDNHLSPSGGHQKRIVLFFIYVQDDLQPWKDKAACCGQKPGEDSLLVAYLPHHSGSPRTKTQTFPTSERWTRAK